MKNLFFMGGPFFMSLLTIMLIAMLAWAVYNFIQAYNHEESMEPSRSLLSHTRSIGLLALITGILGQLIGLMMAFSAIEQAGDISPKLVYAGLKVSMITPMYGLIIYLISVLVWFAMDAFLLRRGKVE